MSANISNPRDLLLLVLGEILYVERRMAGGVLQQLVDACTDDDLRGVLTEHLAQTRSHVERVETAFRRIEAAPTANLSTSFESAVGQHDKLASSIIDPGLGDAFHAIAALRTEHWEIASYTALLQLGREAGYREELADLDENLHDEELARDALRRLHGTT